MGIKANTFNEYRASDYRAKKKQKNIQRDGQIVIWRISPINKVRK